MSLITRYMDRHLYPTSDCAISCSSTIAAPLLLDCAMAHFAVKLRPKVPHG
jgi:hypothetical protein